MSSKNYETNGDGHDLDLLIILHHLHGWCASYPTRSGCREKRIPAYQYVCMHIRLGIGILLQFGDGMPFMSIVQPLTGHETYCRFLTWTRRLMRWSYVVWRHECGVV